jgi:hypothetical protein
VLIFYATHSVSCSWLFSKSSATVRMPYIDPILATRADSRPSTPQEWALRQCARSSRASLGSVVSAAPELRAGVT